jgi:hypothetical protein
LKILKDEIRLAIDQAKGEVSKTVETSIEAEIEARLDPLRKTVAGLRRDSLQEDVQRWIERKVYTNALRSQIAYLRLADEVNNSYFLNEGLDKLEEILKLISSEGQIRPDADLVAQTAATLQSIAPKNPVLVGNLQSQLANLRK